MSSVRALAVALQAVAIGLVGIELVFATAYYIGHAGDGSPGTWLAIPILAALAGLGIVGLRRWRGGGSPVTLYVFDALPVAFLLFSA